jgi:signal-transduction protein with cAMP-binding, CBS, and nucleotidyltransferase domain
MAAPNMHIPITVGEVVRSAADHHDVTSLEAHTLVREAARHMLATDLRWLLVTHEGKTIGVATWRELLHVLAEKPTEADRIDLGNVAWRGPITVEESAPVEEVCRQMLERDLRYATVVRNHRVVGLLMLSDVLRERLQKEEHVVDELAAYINSEYPR